MKLILTTIVCVVGAGANPTAPRPGPVTESTSTPASPVTTPESVAGTPTPTPTSSPVEPSPTPEPPAVPEASKLPVREPKSPRPDVKAVTRAYMKQLKRQRHCRRQREKTPWQKVTDGPRHAEIFAALQQIDWEMVAGLLGPPSKCHIQFSTCTTPDLDKNGKEEVIVTMSWRDNVTVDTKEERAAVCDGLDNQGEFTRYYPGTAIAVLEEQDGQLSPGGAISITLDLGNQGFYPRLGPLVRLRDKRYGVLLHHDGVETCEGSEIIELYVFDDGEPILVAKHEKTGSEC